MFGISFPQVTRSKGETADGLTDHAEAKTQDEQRAIRQEETQCNS